MGASKHGRVAKNTLFLYIRQILVMVIALYTSRIIIEALGIIEYGVYNVVAGVSTTFIFFSVSLASSTQRFLNFTMARGDALELRRVFSQSFWLYVILAALVLIVGVSVGYWLVNDVLVIPKHLVGRALIVFYLMIISLALTVVGSVFESVVISRENMKIYAYMGIFDAVFKLAVAFITFVVPDKLVVYAALMVVAMLVPKIILTVYCLRHYPESKPIKVWDKSLIARMLGFTGWNVYGSLVYVFSEQGINVALNMMFGPVVNAARGIAMQVNSATNSLSTNFFVALRPQLIKTYAEGDMSSERSLFSLASRGSFFLVSCLAIPLIGRMDSVLNLWLGEVPDYSVSFVSWTLIFITFNALNNPLRAVVHATGDIRRSAVEGDTIYFLGLPAGIIMLLLGFPAWTVYPCAIVARLASNLTFLRIVRRAIGLPGNFYTKEIALPIFLATIVSCGWTFCADIICPSGVLGLIGYGAISFAGCIAADFFLGISKDERTNVINRFRGKFSRFSCQ